MFGPKGSNRAIVHQGELTQGYDNLIYNGEIYYPMSGCIRRTYCPYTEMLTVAVKPLGLDLLPAKLTTMYIENRAHYNIISMAQIVHPQLSHCGLVAAEVACLGHSTAHPSC